MWDYHCKGVLHLQKKVASLLETGPVCIKRLDATHRSDPTLSMTGPLVLHQFQTLLRSQAFFFEEIG